MAVPAGPRVGRPSPPRRGSVSCPGAAVAMSHTDDHVVRAVFDRVRDLDPDPERNP